MSDRRAIAAGRRLDQAQSGQPAQTSEALSDPYMTGWLGRLHPALSGPQWESGIIIDAIPGASCYLVSAGKQSKIWCSPAGTSGGFNMMGGRPIHSFGIGSLVFFVRHPETPSQGVIVFAEPHASLHTANQPSDSIWPFVRCGQRIEQAHNYPLLISEISASIDEFNLGGVEGGDYSAGRPIDMTGVGEWGIMMETGVGIFADPFQAYLRVDEETGFFAFYPDQLIRIAGHNYQFRTTIEEKEQLDDEGELIGYSSKCLYPWESFGVWRWNQITPGWINSFTSNHGLAPGQGVAFIDPLLVQTGNGLAAREPEAYDQLPAARNYAWEGYLGQGGHSIISAPAQLGRDGCTPSQDIEATRSLYVTIGDKADAPSGRIFIEGDGEPTVSGYEIPANARGGPDQPGLLEEHRTITGAIHMRTASRIVLAKRPSIPTPRPIRRPEDPYGDSPSNNYFPSGLDLSEGTAKHYVKGSIETDNPSHRASSLPDILAYLFNWENLHPFAYHTEDWVLAQEGDAGSDIVNQETPVFNLLESEQYLTTPTPKFIDIDHRYDLVPIYENEAVVALLEDGSVVIQAGWGEEIRMHNGSISLRCPGDIELLPGRNLITRAGHDIVLNGHDSVDITAAHGDLRLKADHNLHGLAGNSGCGGFLWETKAICPVYEFNNREGEDVISSGFVVIAPKSQFLVIAEDATITLDVDGSEEGRIVLDGGDSRQVQFRGEVIVNRVPQDGAVVHLFDSGGLATSASANEFNARFALFGSQILGSTTIHSAGMISCGGDIIIGGTLTEGEPSAGGLNSGIQGRKNYLINTFKSVADTQAYYPDGASWAEFTCRNTDQYRASSWELWESKWQTMARVDGQDNLPVWSEPVIEGLRTAVLTRPFPGETRWSGTGGFKYPELTFVDGENGWIAINRDQLDNRIFYEDGTLSASVESDLSTSITITVPNG